MSKTIFIVDDSVSVRSVFGIAVKAAGAKAWIVKPFQPPKLLNVQDAFSDGITEGGKDWKVPPLGKIAVGEHVVQQEVVNATINKQGNIKQQSVNVQQTICVNPPKLESLLNLAGELVISSANADLNARKLSDTNLNEAMENLLRLVEGAWRCYGCSAKEH